MASQQKIIPLHKRLSYQNQAVAPKDAESYHIKSLR